MAGNSASAPEAARPSNGIKPKNGHRPLVQIGVVATVVMARVSSSGGAAMNVDADGTRPKRPPQTNARTSGFFAAQDSSLPSGRADKRQRRRRGCTNAASAAGARQRRRGGRRGCVNALTLILDQTKITRRQARHWCKRTRCLVVSIRAVGTAAARASDLTQWQCGTDHTDQAISRELAQTSVCTNAAKCCSAQAPETAVMCRSSCLERSPT